MQSLTRSFAPFRAQQRAVIMAIALICWALSSTPHFDLQERGIWFKPVLLASVDAATAAVPGPVVSTLCDADCAASLGELVKLPSGLEYVDIKVGTGVAPVPGYQVTVNYVAMNAEGRAFDNSIEKGAPYDIRFAASSVIPGLDEGLKTMKSGGIRRLYIPGELSFPKGLPSGPGRPRIPPASPVIFDVQLLLVPGFDNEDE